MKTSAANSILTISNLRELTASTAAEVKNQARLRFTKDLSGIDFDCHDLEFLDSSGLGALIMQILELTRLHRIFEIVA